MFWGGGNKAPPPALVSDLATLRQKQVDNFLLLNRSAVLVSEATYDMTVTTRFGPLKFQVFLPPRFPEHPPQISLFSRVTHRWVDQNMRVSLHPKIQQWGVHNDLGRLVNEVYSEFAVNPPMPAAAPGAVQAQPQQLPQPQPQQPPQPQPLQPQQPVVPEKQHTPQPDIPSSFPELNAKSLAELQALCDDSDALEDFVKEVPSTKTLFELQDGLFQDIEARAKKNLASKAEVEELQAQVAAAQARVQEQKRIHDELRSRQAAVMSRYSLKNVKEALDAAIEQAEDESDAIRKRFEKEDDSSDDESAKGEKLDLNKFCKVYGKQRKLTHERAAKRERLNAQPALT